MVTIEKADLELQALYDTEAEIGERISWLEAERKGLAFQVRRGDPKAVARAGVIEIELKELAAELPAVKARQAQAEQKLEALRAQAAAARLKAARAQREALELATIDAWLHWNNANLAAAAAGDEYERRRLDLLTQENELRALGEPMPGWALPAVSNTARADLLRARKAELESGR
jgi:outer membrane murein-binding lipoprotein Lpp